MYDRHLSRIYRGAQLVVFLWESNGRQAMSCRRLHPAVTSGAENGVNDSPTMRWLSSYLPFVTANFAFFDVMHALTMTSNEEHFIPFSVLARVVQLPNMSLEPLPLSQVVSRVLISTINSINNSEIRQGFLYTSQ